MTRFTIPDVADWYELPEPERKLAERVFGDIMASIRGGLDYDAATGVVIELLLGMLRTTMGDRPLSKALEKIAGRVDALADEAEQARGQLN